MDKHSVELLEFEHVRRDVAGLCAGEEGARRIQEQDFLTDRTELDSYLERTVYAQKLIEADTPEDILVTVETEEQKHPPAG